jgi:hypothetical protein
LPFRIVQLSNWWVGRSQGLRSVVFISTLEAGPPPSIIGLGNGITALHGYATLLYLLKRASIKWIGARSARTLRLEVDGRSVLSWFIV